MGGAKMWKSLSAGMFTASLAAAAAGGSDCPPGGSEDIREAMEAGRALVLGDTRCRSREEAPGGAREELRVGCFHFPPFTIVSPGAGGGRSYSGVEVGLVRAVAARLGYRRVRFSDPADGGMWGNIYPNGSTDGLFRDIVGGRVDLGMAQFFSYPARNEIATPSEFYSFDYFAFVRAKPRPSAKWTQLVRPFQPGAWAAVLAAWALEVAFLLALGRLVRVGPVLLVSLGYFINQSIGWRADALRPGAARLFVGAVSLSGAVLGISYGGTLMSFLSVTTYPALHHRIEELALFPGDLGSTGLSELEQLRASPSPAIRALAGKFRQISSWQEGMDLVGRGEYAFANSLLSSQYNIRTRFTDGYGNSHVYVMREPWFTHLVVLYFPRDSPLPALFNPVIRRLREAGVVGKLIRDEMDAAARVSNSDRAETGARSLGLADLGVVLAVAAAGAGVAAAAFALEAALGAHQRWLAPPPAPRPDPLGGWGLRQVGGKVENAQADTISDAPFAFRS